MTRTSGKYESNDTRIREIVNLDIDGHNPQNTVSGTIYNPFRENTHWIAELKSNGSKWTGEIWYLEGYSQNFFYHSVEVELISVGNLEVTFLSDFRKRKVSYRQVSFQFRPISFELDFEDSVKPVTSVKTHAHPHRPLNLVDEKLSIGNVFERAGFDVSVTAHGTSIPLTEAGSNKTWSNSEMHDAMQMYWSQYSNDPQWAMWVFFAGLHDDGESLGGIMFDSIGQAHRQGTAIFNNSFINKAPANDPEPDAWRERMKFWTACHEMGHAFNMAHSWQKSLGHNWIPLEDEKEARSFMNYPFRVGGGQEAFFKSFEYRFSNSELLYLRHAPEHFVQMGSAKWFDEHGFENLAQEPSNRLRLELFTSQQGNQFEFLEPAMFELKIENVGLEPLLIDQNILDSNHDLTVAVKREGSDAKLFRSFSYECYQGQPRILQPGEQLQNSLFIAASLNEWIIAEPGHYVVQASLHANNTHIVSNELWITVRPPRQLEEEHLAQDYFSEDVGRIMAFDGSRIMDAGNACLHQLVDHFGDTKAAFHAKIALGMPYMKNHKKFDFEKRQIVELSADVDTAAKHLSSALEQNKEESIKTLGYSDYEYYLKKFKDNLND